MGKEYQDRIKQYCKDNNITVKSLAKFVDIPYIQFVPSYQKRDLTLMSLIKLEPYIKDLEVFKIDIAIKMKSLMFDYRYQYFDKDMVSKEDFIKIYEVLKPYIVKEYKAKKNKKEG